MSDTSEPEPRPCLTFLLLAGDSPNSTFVEFGLARASVALVLSTSYASLCTYVPDVILYLAEI